MRSSCQKALITCCFGNCCFFVDIHCYCKLACYMSSDSHPVYCTPGCCTLAHCSAVGSSWPDPGCCNGCCSCYLSCYNHLGCSLNCHSCFDRTTFGFDQSCSCHPLGCSSVDRIGFVGKEQGSFLPLMELELTELV